MSEAVSLWAVAWLTGKLSLSSVSQSEMEWDIAMSTAFARRRYLHVGRDNPSYILCEYLPVWFSFYLKIRTVACADEFYCRWWTRF
jgi:hypothetical protein